MTPIRRCPLCNQRFSRSHYRLAHGLLSGSVYYSSYEGGGNQNQRYGYHCKVCRKRMGNLEAVYLHYASTHTAQQAAPNPGLPTADAIVNEFFRRFALAQQTISERDQTIEALNREKQDLQDRLVSLHGIVATQAQWQGEAQAMLGKALPGE